MPIDRVLLVSFCCIIFAPMLAAGADDVEGRLIDCGKEKAVIFPDTVSKDGRYAVGWTLRPVQKKSKPVDWSLWDESDASKLLGHYSSDLDDKNRPYQIVDLVVDLHEKKTLDLPSDWPDWPHKNRGYIAAIWSNDRDGTRYGLIQNDARFFTCNLWFIVIDPAGMHQMDLAGPLGKAISRTLREKRPLNFDDYGLFFPLCAEESNDHQPQASFGVAAAKIPFEAEIPKSLDPDSSVEGFITIGLPGGVVGKVSCDASADNPFKDNAELAKADGELNKVYAALQRQLKPAEQSALKKEQIAWIKQRDYNAGHKNGGSTEESEGSRNASLLAATKRRTDELKERLKKIPHSR